MKNIGVIILTRFNSTRLPGKALRSINGKQVLTYILERLTQVIPITNIVVATSIESTDDPIHEYTVRMGVKCFRGSLENVAERFFDAAIRNSFDYAIRINGDNLFVDINLLRNMIQLVERNNYDFISNVKNRTYPPGMSIEIVRTQYFNDHLKKIRKNAAYREHVTLYFYEHEEAGKYHYIYNDTYLNNIGVNLAIDTQEDFLRCRNIINKFDLPHWEYNFTEILNILKEGEL
jgi:spore coat polysaccharide biosynthesis protein SpsF